MEGKQPDLTAGCTAGRVSSSAWLDYRQQRGERWGTGHGHTGRRATLRSLAFILRPWGQKPIQWMIRIAELSGTTGDTASGGLISDFCLPTPPKNLTISI